MKADETPDSHLHITTVRQPHRQLHIARDSQHRQLHITTAMPKLFLQHPVRLLRVSSHSWLLPKLNPIPYIVCYFGQGLHSALVKISALSRE